MEGDAGAARSAETLLRARLDAQVARDRHRDRLRVIDADTRRAEEEARAADAKVALARDVLRDLERARDDARRRHAELAARRELAEVAARDAAGALAERDAALLRAGVSPARPVAVDDHDPSPSAPPWTESPSDFADWSASDDPAEPLRGGARTIPIPDVRDGVSPTSFTSSRRRAGGETLAWNLRRVRASADATRLGGASRRETSADDPNPGVPRVPKPTPRHVPPAPFIRAGHGANPPPTTTLFGRSRREPFAAAAARVCRAFGGTTRVASLVARAVSAGDAGDGPAKGKRLDRLVEETWRTPTAASAIWTAFERHSRATIAPTEALRVLAAAHDVARRGSPAMLTRQPALVAFVRCLRESAATLRRTREAGELRDVATALAPTLESTSSALAAKLEFHASRREWENNYWCDVYVGDVRGGTPRGETLGALMDVAVAFREALDAAVAATPSNPTMRMDTATGQARYLPWHVSLANVAARAALETRATHDALARALWTITEGSAWDSTKMDDAMRRFVERREAEVDAAERSFADAAAKPTIADAFVSTGGLDADESAFDSLAAPFWRAGRTSRSPRGSVSEDADGARVREEIARAARDDENRARAEAVAASRAEAAEARLIARAARERRESLAAEMDAKARAEMDAKARAEAEAPAERASAENASAEESSATRGRQVGSPRASDDFPATQDPPSRDGDAASDSTLNSDADTDGDTDTRSASLAISAAAKAVHAETRASLPTTHVPRAGLTPAQARALGPAPGDFCAARYCARVCVESTCAAFARRFGDGGDASSPRMDADALARRLRKIAIRNHPDRHRAERVGMEAWARATAVTQQATLLESMLREGAP